MKWCWVIGKEEEGSAVDFRGKRRRIGLGMALEWVASLREAKNSLRLSPTALSSLELDGEEEEGRMVSQVGEVGFWNCSLVR